MRAHSNADSGTLLVQYAFHGQEALNLFRSDAELVEAARAGDVDSFAELYQRYFAFAEAIAKGQLFDAHLAEDAAQESFDTACRSLKTLKDPGRFAFWLRTIVRRTANKARKKQRIQFVQFVEEVDGAQQTMPVRENEITKRVEEAVAKLPLKSRELIHLHYSGELTYEQMSKILGLSTQSIHGRLQRARKKLRYLLRELD